jgi:hypothetical protein
LHRFYSGVSAQEEVNSNDLSPVYRILAIGAVLLPHHNKANPDYVRSASARADLQDIGDANTMGDISAAPSARADTAYVSGNAMETRSFFEQGFLTL